MQFLISNLDTGCQNPFVDYIIVQYSFSDFIIRETLGVEPLIFVGGEITTIFFGHENMNRECMAGQIVNTVPLEGRQRERPHIHWLDQVLELGERTGIEADQVREGAADHVKWRRRLSTLQPRPS